MQNIVISVVGMVAGEWVMNRFFRPKPPPIAPGAHLTAHGGQPPPAPEHPLMAYLEPAMDPGTKEECVLLFEQGSPDELTHGALELLKFGFPIGAKILIDRAEQVRQWLLEDEAAKGRELTSKELQHEARKKQNLAALENERDRIAKNIAKLKNEPPSEQTTLAHEGLDILEYPAEAKRPEVFRNMPEVPDDEVGFTQSIEKDTRPFIDPNDPLPQVARDTAPVVHPADLGLVSRSHGSLSEEAVTSYVNGATHEGPTEGAHEGNAE